jgi:putative RNA 2'-phosphotransferase
MLTQNSLIKISKYLSYHLGHLRDQLGLKFVSGSWINIDNLLATA